MDACDSRTPRIETETKHWLLCPSCGGRVGTIDHLIKEGRSIEAGPWSCAEQDGCGVCWSFVFDGETVISVTPSAKRYVAVTVELVLPPQTEPIYFTLNDRTHEPISDESSTYFYHQHTCPTNWMRNVVEIRIGDDRDPHGLFEFVSIKPGHVADSD